MRILVTGATGFVGSYVVRKLAQEGHTVFGTTRGCAGNGGARQVSFRPVAIDLTDLSGVRSMVHEIRPEMTIHLAWCTQPGDYWTSPENLDYVASSLQLAKALSESGCRKLVVAGTCAEYDWEYGFLSEDSTPLRPRTLYGACKNGLREILEAYCLRQSMPFAWTRLFYLYGPGEKKERLVSSITIQLLREKSARCTSGEQLRDFLHVEDVASAIVAVSLSGFTGAINIGSGLPVKVRTLVEMIAAASGAMGGPAFGALPQRQSEPPLLVADVRKLTQEVGWQPKWSLEQGLRETVNWWKAQLETVEI